jgi:hypothetical protein
LKKLISGKLDNNKKWSNKPMQELSKLPKIQSKKKMVVKVEEGNSKKEISKVEQKQEMT